MMGKNEYVECFNGFVVKHNEECAMGVRFTPDGVDDSISLEDYPDLKINYRRLIFELWRLRLINLPTMLSHLWRGE